MMGLVGRSGGVPCGFCPREMDSCIYVHKGPTTRSLRYKPKDSYEQARISLWKIVSLLDLEVTTRERC
jgi:hypothetical protein